MANNEASSLNTQRTIREYLSTQLVDSKVNEEGVGLKITINDVLTPAYNVDLVWNGQEYLISCDYVQPNSDPGAEEVIITGYIDRLADVLPLQFWKTPALPSETTTS